MVPKSSENISRSSLITIEYSWYMRVGTLETAAFFRIMLQNLISCFTSFLSFIFVDPLAAVLIIKPQSLGFISAAANLSSSRSLPSSFLETPTPSLKGASTRYLPGREI